MKDVAVSSYFLPIISAERELIGNNKLFLIFSYLSRKARTYIGENKEKRIGDIISVHRNRPPVARPVNPSEIRFLACGLCCGFVVSAC